MTRARWMGLLAAVAAVMLAGGVGPVPAYAHNVLVSSTPAMGAKVASPTKVSFTFNDVVLNRFYAVAVTGPDRRAYQSGPVTIVDNTVSVPIQPAVTGAYVAAYRIVSADGHPISGEIAFTVTAVPPGAKAPVVPTTATPVAPGAGAPNQPSGSAEGGSGVTPILIGGGAALLVVAVGAVILATRRRPPPPAE